MREIVCDLLVAGAGAGGFAAAVTAAAHGADVLMVEKASVFGGTTSYSAGVIWIPGSRQARVAGIQDSREAALAYLEAEAGNRLDRSKAIAYVDRAAEALAWFEDHTHVRYALSPTWADYHPDRPGASQGGRSLGPLPFDGRTLGARFAELKPPLATTTILGGMMVGREDLPHFFAMTKSRRSALHAGRLFLRYVRDRLTHPRGTRLSNGNALVAMLARSAFERGVRLMLETPVSELNVEGGRVTGALIGTADGPALVRARKGVVLACGGFPANGALRARFMAHAAAGADHRTLAPATNTGDGLDLAGRVGVGMVEDQARAAALAPVSLVPQPDGSTIPFPHFIDRGKAGYIAVNRNGRRFISEAVSYHDFVPAMIEACAGADGREIHCHLICDSDAIRAFGLGRAPPFPGRVAPYVRSGYLKRGATLADLAAACGIDPGGLAATVARWNEGAALGEDRDFAKGADAYQRFNGSQGRQPNPCVAPIARGPFYAVRLLPGDIGTFIGLRTDELARALDRDGRVVEGLYVVGNDAASFMGGTYPGAGITIGPALVFGHIAARHACAD